jgi:hypothetical protein
MPEVMTANDIADLYEVATQKDLGPLSWEEISTDLQEHPALNRMMRRNKVEFLNSGTAIQRSLVVDHSGAARNVGLYNQDNVNVGDVMKTISVPWRHSTTDFAFDRREISMNREPSRINNLFKVRRIDGMTSLAELMESNWFGHCPESGDEETPYGFFYWLAYNASTGFNGGDDNVTGGPGGLASATYPRWKNWTAAYTAVTKADLIALMRRGYHNVGFKPPVRGTPTLRRGGPRHEFLLNLDTLMDIEELGEAQNENLGKDIASMDGKMVFRGAPLTYVPYLDKYSTSDPILGIDWSTFMTYCLRGEYLRESRPEKAPHQHNVMQVFIDITWQTLCINRRRNMLIAKSDPESDSL